MMSVVKKITQFYMRKEKKQGHDILIYCVVTHPKHKTKTRGIPKQKNTNTHKKNPNQKHKTSAGKNKTE